MHKCKDYSDKEGYLSAIKEYGPKVLEGQGWKTAYWTNWKATFHYFRKGE